MPETYHSPVVRYWWMDWAARRPAPMARITVALPVTFARRALCVFVGLNIAALVRAETRRRALHDRVGAGADRDDCDRQW